MPEQIGKQRRRGMLINLVCIQEGWTALHLAASEDLEEIVSMLLSAGANYEVTDTVHAANLVQTTAASMTAAYTLSIAESVAGGKNSNHACPRVPL